MLTDQHSLSLNEPLTHLRKKSLTFISWPQTRTHKSLLTVTVYEATLQRKLLFESATSNKWPFLKLTRTWHGFRPHHLSGIFSWIKRLSRGLIHLLLSIFHFSENTWNNNRLRWAGSIITLNQDSINWKPTFQWHHNIMNTYLTAQLYLYLLHNKFKNALVWSLPLKTTLI